MKRAEDNPIITINDIKPSFDFMEVKGVFNAGAIEYKGEIYLLLRIAEGVKSDMENILNVPLMRENGEIEIKKFDITDGKYDYTDPRVIYQLNTKKTEFLTTLSHLRLAKSKDGIKFVIDEKPTIWPNGKLECWGIEDPRIIEIDKIYYINFTVVSQYGAATKMIKTTDFVNYDEVGIIFPPENKDVCVIPKKVNNKYYCFHRPVPKSFGEPDIWTAISPDLMAWGEHQHFLGVTDFTRWDGGRIGGGAPAILIDEGWLSIYHASSVDNVYSLGAFITQKDNPIKLQAISKEPILKPEAIYETSGFFKNVVFTCGVVKRGETLMIYYGASDDKMCLATIDICEVLEHLEVI